MARAHHVKSARKDNPAVKKGEPYYWWKFRYGGKYYSKTQPRQSQLTQSEYLSAVYEFTERLESYEASTLDDVEGLAQELKEIASEAWTLGEEQYDKLMNMPDSLQDSDTGQLLEQRQSDMEFYSQELEHAADEIESLHQEFVEEYTEDFPERKPEGEEHDEALVKWNEALDSLITTAEEIAVNVQPEIT